MYNHHPVKITAYPAAPIIADHYLPIDGLLTAMAADTQIGWNDITSPGITERINTHPPLRKMHGKGWWLYYCSFAIWPDVVAIDQGYWTKRFDAAELKYLDPLRDTVTTSQGRYRPMHIPFSTHHAEQITWYAVGDIDAIRGLLRRAYFLGKKGAQGYGFIREWRVEPIDDDWSIRGPNGELMRSIPIDQARADDARGHYGLHPPYWRPDHQQLVAIPRRDV